MTNDVSACANSFKVMQSTDDFVVMFEDSTGSWKETSQQAR